MAFVATVLLVATARARAQFGGTCGYPVIVSDPQMYGRQGEQLTQEKTRIADLAAQNTTVGDSGL